jgi:hypothetical protein
MAQTKTRGFRGRGKRPEFYFGKEWNFAGAKQAAEKLEVSRETGGKRYSGAEARVDSVGLMRG